MNHFQQTATLASLVSEIPARVKYQERWHTVAISESRVELTHYSSMRATIVGKDTADAVRNTILWINENIPRQHWRF